jgi:hypothetical protein
MVRDVPRDDMPGDVAWNLQDLIPDLGATLRKRGGYTYESPNITTIQASASYMTGGIYAEFAAGAKNLSLDEDGRLYNLISATSATDIGAAVTISQNPVFHRDKVIITHSGGTTAPKVYDGTTLGNLGGSPPAAVYSVVYKDRTVMGRSNANKNRTWFSVGGNPESWDTTASYIDTDSAITGLAKTRNALLVFHSGATEKLRGATPPSTPGGAGDFDREPLFELGCIDARSIAYWGDNIIFANTGGIYLTDGVVPFDVTNAGAMKTYWLDTMSAWTSSYTVAGNVFRDYYFLTVMNGSTFVDAFMIDLQKRDFLRLQNVDATSYWRSSGTSEQLYFGRRGAARVGSMSSIFSPTAARKNDADGGNVGFVLETPFYRGRWGHKTWKQVYVAYDLREDATDNPTISIDYVNSPESTIYTTLTDPLAKSTFAVRAARDLRLSEHGLAFRLRQVGPSSNTRIYELETDVFPWEESRD